MKPEEKEHLCYFNVLQDRAFGEIQKEGKTKTDIKRWLGSIKASKVVAEEIISILSRSCADIKVAVEEEASYQREAYSCFNKTKLNRYYKFYYDSLKESEEYLQEQYPKKVRTKKHIPAEKVVQNLNFLSKDESLNLQSISPHDILGASMLTVYNTKTKILSLYHAKDGGVSVKGSTLVNWDEDKSFSKRLRKPKEMLAMFVNAGFALVQPRFDGIKTKPTKTNGRVNNHTLILWSKKVKN